MAKKLSSIFLFLIIMISITSCPPADNNGDPTPTPTSPPSYTISGTIFNSITGDGIDAVNVLIGEHSTTTNSSGYFSVTIDSSNLITGLFAAWKGTDYMFRLVQGISIDPANNPSYNLGLYPYSTPPPVNVSGTLNPAGTENANMDAVIINSSGGKSVIEDVTINSPYADYSFDTQTTGDDCLIVINYDDNDVDTNSPIIQYYKNQNLSGNLTLDVEAATTSTININNSNTTTNTYGLYRAHLYATGYGIAPAYVPGIMTEYSIILNDSDQNIEVYNPDSDFQLVWSFIQVHNNQPDSDDVTYELSFSQKTDITSSPVNLPSKIDTPNPTTGVEAATTATWNDITNTLSFESAPGSTSYVVNMQSDNSLFGNMFLSNNTVDIPAGLVTDVFNADTGWNVQVVAIWASDFNHNTFIDMEMYGSMGPISLDDIQVKYIIDDNAEAVDLIN